MITRTIDDLTYMCFKSSEVNEALAKDFITVTNTVFNINTTEDDFKKKFNDNIYGDSVIVLVYDKEKPIAARALWRNDLDNILSYQPCDTAVSSEYRGRNIFKHMTDIALEQTENAVIYNYPNNNSRKLYLRNGWVIKNEYFLNLFTSNKSYLKYNGDIIDDEYYIWWFKSRKNLFKFRFMGKNYLLRKRSEGFFIIIGIISDNIFSDSELKKAGPGIILYRSTKRPFHKTSAVYSVIQEKSKNINVPLFKMDAM